jgi:protein TonB
MEARNCRNDGQLNEGMLSSLGVSLLAHATVFFLVAWVPWTFQSRGTSLKVCTVSLITAQEMGGGSEAGEKNPAGKGEEKSESAAGVDAFPASVQPTETAESVVAEPEAARVPELVREAVPLVSDPPKVERVPEKPKPKPKPRPLTKPHRVQQTVARAEIPPSALPKSIDEHTGASEKADGGNSESTGLGKSGDKGNSGDGSGVGHRAGGSSGGGTFEASFGSTDGPKFATRTLPKYPRIARQTGKEGTVILRITIDERGRLVEVEVVKSAGSGFDEEAVRAVRESSFCPAKKNGKPVTCRARLPVRFALAGAGDG